MRLILDGHRLTIAEVLTLLDTMGWREMAAGFSAEGFHLKPIRAPKRMPNGRFTIRLCWQRQDGMLVETIRLTARA
jgi:hypothetical protein